MIHFLGETVKAERVLERDPEDRRRNKGMSKLKYMLGALGLSMALIMTGCGAAGGSQNTDSSWRQRNHPLPQRQLKKQMTARQMHLRIRKRRKNLPMI